MLHIILLCGGVGKRLWPLSNIAQSKQFIKCFDNNGTFESPIQRVYRQYKEKFPDSNITVVVSKHQISNLKAQVSECNICEEPYKGGTFKAISLACLKLLKDEANINDYVIVSPVDLFIDDNFLMDVEKLYNIKPSNLGLIGIVPKEINTKYGYILPINNSTLSNVSEFKEKPDKDYAQYLVENGALINSGIFCFRLEYIKNKINDILNTDSYDNLLKNYSYSDNKSFDYVVSENEDNIVVLRSNSYWNDLGTWDTIKNLIIKNKHYTKNIISENCNNSTIINSTDKQLVAYGLENTTIVNTLDGILVFKNGYENYLKDILETLDDRAFYEERTWGSYEVLKYNKNGYLIKILNIKNNKNLSFQMHYYREEIWVVINGYGIAYVGNSNIELVPKSIVYIPKNVKHSIKANSDLIILEIQIGDILSEEDEIRF